MPIKYIVMNLTDGIPGPFPEPFDNEKEAKAAIKKWRTNFRKTQPKGYRTNRWEYIDPDDVQFEIKPVDWDEDDD